VGESPAVQALVVVDAQVAFLSGPSAVPVAQELLATINELLRSARENGALIVQLQNDGPAGAVDEPGSPGWELIFPTAPRDREVVIRKTTDDGFHGTDLAGLLADHGVRDLVVCGVMSEMCVSATVRSALALGYHVVLPHDAHATYDIPAAEGIAELVPHAMVSRVAEWSLGDEVDVIARAADVRFVP
jgi:nicotinamidase-related amidase